MISAFIVSLALYIAFYLYTRLPFTSSDVKNAIIAQHSKVILPLIRRIMPSIIAYDIIGVSPMTGPTADVFKLKVRYADDEKKKQITDQLVKNTQEQMLKDLNNKKGK